MVQMLTFVDLILVGGILFIALIIQISRTNLINLVQLNDNGSACATGSKGHLLISVKVLFIKICHSIFGLWKRLTKINKF